MKHDTILWKTENAIMYMELLVIYTKQRKNATRKKAKLIKLMECLKHGYRHCELSEYL